VGSSGEAADRVGGHAAHGESALDELPHLVGGDLDRRDLQRLLNHGGGACPGGIVRRKSKCISAA
jgi:hypothetical protein